MIKILNRREIGNLFHYAHFICDCLFPEIVTNICKYKRIIREKSISQTLGNFLPIYCKIMRCKCIELEPQKFDEVPATLYINKAKEDLTHPFYFKLFRKYIFNRFKINPFIYYPKYPSVILIQRGKRVNLITDPSLQSHNLNYTNGAERREINNIENIKMYMKNKFGNHFQTLFLENIPFEEQIQYFNNAKIIVCAHGACMSNLFFCKTNTMLFEVTCGEIWPFFDVITKNLQIIHHKIEFNLTDVIMKTIENETMSICDEIKKNDIRVNESWIEDMILKKKHIFQRKNIHKKKNETKQQIPKPLVLKPPLQKPPLQKPPLQKPPAFANKFMYTR